MYHHDFKNPQQMYPYNIGMKFSQWFYGSAVEGSA
jgi:hypothetical protein